MELYYRMKNIVVDKDNNITIIKINRYESRNAVNYDTSIELRNAFLDFNEDNKQHIAILTGEGGTFSAGADLTDVEKMSPEVLNSYGPMGFTRMEIKKPLIAAISGYCVAGGLEMALTADIRIAGEESKFGFLERRFGVPLIDGGTQRLPKIIGLGRALDMILTGKLIDAKEAYNIGLVNYLTEKNNELDYAIELAKKIDQFPEITMNNDRAATYKGMALDLYSGLKTEAEYGKKSLDSGSAISGSSKFVEGHGRHGKSI